ncbi:hypothetical protein PISL3812_01256 [Talaromyces islandicus]|uniref:Uncharacterized protein n=1 Tax=Talaromyces islandicus TaxID=28573 RepID=A0A0U1LNP8_TALIS|nr:hypothetical protein PISL3812_01256 [Talaromyces islandicus]
MTNLYNLLKSRAMRSQIQTAASDSVSQALQSLPRTNNTRVPMSGTNNFTSNGNRSMVPQSTRLTSRHFNALSSPEYQALGNGAERLSKHQRSGGASSREKQGRLGVDLESMPPPKLPFPAPQQTIPTPSHHRTRLPATPHAAFVRNGQHQMEQAVSSIDFDRFKDFTINPG